MYNLSIVLSKDIFQDLINLDIAIQHRVTTVKKVQISGTYFIHWVKLKAHFNFQLDTHLFPWVNLDHAFILNP